MLEGVRGQGRDLRGALRKLHGTNRSGVAEALDFSAIVNEKRGQHLPGTREWVFEAVLRWRTDPDSAKLFWLLGGGGTGKSVAAAELLARLLDKQNARVAFLQAHRAGPVRTSGAVAVSGGHDVCDGGGLRGRARTNKETAKSMRVMVRMKAKRCL